MKKSITVFLTIALTAGSLLGEVPRTMKEAMELIQEGKARKLPDNGKMHLREKQENNISIPSEKSMMQNITQVETLQGSQSKKMAPTPMRVTAGGSAIYGFCNYSNDETVSPIGLYEFEQEGIKLKWVDKFIYSEYYTLDSGFLIDDQLIGCGIETFMGYVFAYSRLVFDFETGKLLSRIDYDYSDPNVVMYEMISYNSQDSYVYGIATAEDQKTYWYRTTPADFGSGERLREVPNNLTALCYNESENAFFALNTIGEIIRIDIDGSVSTLFKLDLPQIDFRYLAGLVYSPMDKAYYASLSAYTDQPEGYIALIDVEDKSVRSVWQLEHANQFKTMITTDEADENPLKPQIPTIEEISFENGSTSGYIDFKMPSATVDGSQIEGTIHAFPTVNGTPVGPSEGYSTAPGAILRVEYTDLPEGKDSFKIYISDGKYTSRTLTKSFWVGNDTPVSPTKVVLTDHNVTWKAVTKSENKGYLAVDEIYYEVFLNGELLGETTGTSFDLTLPTDKDYAAYTASIVAVCRGKESTPGFSNSVVSGRPYELPLYFEASEETEQLCTVINNNNDPAYWIYNPAYKAFNIGYCTIGNNDDWIILPAFEATSTDSYYTLTFETTRFIPNVKNEFLSVYCGSTPTIKGMATEIVPTFAPITGLPEYEKIRVLFKANETGACHIGFHCTSDQNQFGLLIKNIHIENNNVTDASPAQVLNLDAQPFEEGELKATISFNLPRKTIGGESISKDTEVCAYIKGKETIKVSGRPGQRVSAVINTDQGNNRISVMSSIGDLGSLASEINVYTGVVPPETPVITNLISSPDMQSLKLEWDPVTKGVNGGYIDPADIKYSIYTMKQDVWGNKIWQEYEQVGNATTYTYTCEPGTPLQFFYIGVASYNAAGSNGSVRAQMGQIGTPYSLPISEDFTSGYLTLPTWLSLNPFDEYRVEFEFKELVEIGDFDINAEYLLMGVGNVGEKGRLAVPRFSSQGVDHAKMSMTLYTGENSAPVDVYVGYTGAKSLIKLGSLESNPSGPDFTTVSFDIPEEAMEKFWVQIYVDTELVNSQSLCLIKAISVTPDSGIEEVADSKRHIYGGKDMISIYGHDHQKIRIHDISGKLIADFTAQGNLINYPVTKGIYLVVVDDETTKVVVR